MYVARPGVTELNWYTHKDPLPADAATSLETQEFLAACQKFIENGLSSHNKVCDNDSGVIKKNNNEGFFVMAIFFVG